MTDDRSSPGAWDHRQEPQFDHPGPDTAFQDWIDLANDRAWMIAQENHDSFDNPPRIWLEQYSGDVDLADVTGRVWLHPEDIPALIKHFLKKSNLPDKIHFSDKAIQRMKEYHWPGNIRELQNVVERCVIFRKGAGIEEDDLKLSMPAPSTSSDFFPEIPEEGISLQEIEKSLIVKALAKAGNNKTKAAKLLHIPRHVLIYRLEKFDLNT